jgi:hypothetical protein
LTTGLIALVGAIALPLGVAGPASADQARQRQQWVLSALEVSAAWHVTQGQGVTVAVIDSGVDPSVSDLTGSVISGPDYTGVHTPRSNPNWGAHGTWMASLIAGHGHDRGNMDGILGVAPKAKILSIRVITDRSDPGYHAYETEPPWRGQHELAKAITYSVRHGADVINMSLGYDGASRAVRSALQGALAHNVVVVASSGNAGASHAAGRGSAPYSFPADYPGVIGVAAVTEAGEPAYFSSENLSVQVAAPGVDVPAQGRGSKYWVVSGTSPASALTAGVAALIKSRFPKLTAAQVRSAITGSSANRPRGGYDPHVGFGTVNAAAALRLAGRLAKQVPAGQTQVGQAAVSGNFGGGEKGVPAFPVPPRSRQKLLVFGGIAAGGVLFLIIAVWLLASSRRRRRAAKKRGPIGVTARLGPVGAAGTVGPMSQARPGHPVGSAAAGTAPGPFGAAGAAGSAMDVRYPTQIYPAQRPGLPVQGYISQPGETMAVQGFLGHQEQTLGPGQGTAVQGVPGQPVPALDGPVQGTAGVPGQDVPPHVRPNQPGQFGERGQFGQPAQFGEPGQFGQPEQTPQAAGAATAGFGPQGYAGPGQTGPEQTGPGYPDLSFAGPTSTEVSQPSAYPASGAGTGYVGRWRGQGTASPTIPPPAHQDDVGGGPGYGAPADHSAPANGVSTPAPALPAVAGQESADDSEWLFEDGPSAQADGPAPTAITATPAGADQSGQPGQSDPHESSGMHPAARPGRAILPEPDAGGLADEDPLTSPRYARDGRAERALRPGGYRPDWLSSRQGVTKPMPSPAQSGQPGAPAQPAPPGPEPLPSRARQQVQAEQTSQPVQPSPAAAAGSAEAAAAQPIPAVDDEAAASPLAQQGGAQTSEPAARSVWEPPNRSRPNPADPGSGEPGQHVGPSIKTGPSAWQTSPSRQPASWRQGDATAVSSESASSAAAAQTVSGPGAPDTALSGPGYEHESSPSAEPGSGASAQPSFGAAHSRRQNQQGSDDGLPKRQPMTHLAAPLRRSWPSPGSDEQASAGSLPSVWDTWRRAAGVRRAAQEDGSDSGDGQA